MASWSATSATISKAAGSVSALSEREMFNEPINSPPTMSGTTW